MIGAINGEPHSHVEKSARSQHLLNLRLVLICGRLSLCRIEDDRYVSPSWDRRSSVFLRRVKKDARRYRDQLFSSITLHLLSLSLFVLTIGYKAFRRETVDSMVSPSPPSFTNAIPTLIFSVSEPRRSDPPRGFFDDRRRTKRGRKRSLSLAEIIIPGDT